jgi:hypothetical protein
VNGHNPGGECLGQTKVLNTPVAQMMVDTRTTSSEPPAAVHSIKDLCYNYTFFGYHCNLDFRRCQADSKQILSLENSVTSLEHRQILRELATDNWLFNGSWSDRAHGIITDLVVTDLLIDANYPMVLYIVIPTVISSEEVNINSLVIQRPHSLR